MVGCEAGTGVMGRAGGGVGGAVASEGLARVLVVTVAGVQRFIGQARKAADLASGSRIVSDLMGDACRAVGAAAGCELVYPVAGQDGTADVPNRLVAVVPAGWKRDDVSRMVEGVAGRWEQAAAELGVDVGGEGQAFPRVLWVLSPPVAVDQVYAKVYGRAGTVLAARKRIRDFGFFEQSESQLCRQCGLRQARTPPQRAAVFHRDEGLCATCWAKRLYPQQVDMAGFPSTSDVASAPFRWRLLEAAVANEDVEAGLALLVDCWHELVRLLRELEVPVGVPDPERLPAVAAAAQTQAGEDLLEVEGSWLYGESWRVEVAAGNLDLDLAALSDADRQRLVGLLDDGREIVAELVELVDEVPGAYLAVVTQDADSMGAHFRAPGGQAPTRRGHGRLSELMLAAAAAQRAAVREQLGRVVYAGGDDLVGFVPVAGALPAAEAARRRYAAQLAGELDDPTACTAVVFVHRSHALQDAVDRARQALQQAKDADPGKDRLAVVVVRRGGERARTLLRWRDADGRVAAAGRLVQLADMFANVLSPRIVGVLEAEQAIFARPDTIGDGELGRLVDRHCNGSPADCRKVADLLDWLRPGRGAVPAGATRLWLGALQAALFADREG